MKKYFKVYDNFKEAEEEERLERWSMTPAERLNILESLRKVMYGKDKLAPRLQRSFEVIDFPQS